MDFKHINDKSDKHTTPKSEINILSKRISHGIGSVATDSPFRNLPCFSTPPSRFAKIINPFDQHLIERLHLPTFSPNVFVQNSTPKAEQKFKWTIDDISSLKPADIDETTVSQHVCTTDDPQIDSIVQQKIDTFFSEKEIVPSPMNVKIGNVPLLKDCNSSVEDTPPKAATKNTCEGATQTVLTLPPILPKELEEALKPYFTYNEDRKDCDENSMTNTSLYRQLFEFEEDACESAHSHDDVQSLLSSPAISTGLSPIQFSPCSRGPGSPIDMPELKDCNLSPITKSSPKLPLSRSSVCHQNFLEKMSVDVSLIVPDLDNQQMSSRSCFESDNIQFSPIRQNEITVADATVNWSMEYKQISLGSPSSSLGSDKMDVSSSNTPHSKLFTGKGYHLDAETLSSQSPDIPVTLFVETVPSLPQSLISRAFPGTVGQRKRLSESFKSEELENNENDLQYHDCFVKNRSKVFRNDLTDAGYYTQTTGDFSNNCTNVFASTPSKRIAKVDFQ